MRTSRSLVIAAALAASAVSALHISAAQPSVSAPDRRPRFRSTIKLTTVNATVTDADGRLVHGLPRERFEIFEDGERQTITQFTAERVPVSLAVLVDASDSMFGRRIADAREAIDHFVSDMLAPEDEYSLMAFNHHQELLTPWTDDRRAGAMLAPLKPWGSTAIYDAILAALPLADSRHKPRAALLVVSDGADTASDVSIRDLLSALRRTDLFVYAIGIDSAERRAINTAVNPAALAQITDPSGGRTRVVHDSAEVAQAFAQIAEELNSQYLIGYSPTRPADGKYHSIRVRVSDGDYRVRARNGYVQ
ncbi:MAG: VWA domain-containing protein [Vicinamibacterales bacterium]